MAEVKIVRNPDILGGKPTIEGTRLSVELIIDFMAAGSTREDLLSNYPNLTNEMITACLIYAREHLPTTIAATAAE